MANYSNTLDGKVSKMKQSSSSTTPTFMKEMIPNLPLAVALHFNAYFSVAYAFLIGRLVALKLMHFRFYDGLQEVLLLPAYCVWLAVEGLRIYLGQSGNLCEQVSKVAAFLLLSIFPQLLIVLYLAFFQEFVFPCDYAVGSLMLVMIVLEVIFGCQALRSFIQRQTKLFYSTYGEGEMQRLDGEESNAANQLFFSKNILGSNDSCDEEPALETEWKGQEEKFDMDEAKL